MTVWNVAPPSRNGGNSVITAASRRFAVAARLPLKASARDRYMSAATLVSFSNRAKVSTVLSMRAIRSLMSCCSPGNPSTDVRYFRASSRKANNRSSALESCDPSILISLAASCNWLRTSSNSAMHRSMAAMAPSSLSPAFSVNRSKRRKAPCNAPPTSAFRVTSARAAFRPSANCSACIKTRRCSARVSSSPGCGSASSSSATAWRKYSSSSVACAASRLAFSKASAASRQAL